MRKTTPKLALPYVAYRTFRTFLEFLGEDMPARVDRSVWNERFSGSSGIQLTAALRALQLVDAEDRPKPELERLIFATGRERRELLQRILRRTYAPLFKIDLARATKAQFSAIFKTFDVSDKLQVKCEAFFVQAAQDAGIELSQFILKGRHNLRPKPPTPATSNAQPPATANTDDEALNPQLAIAKLIIDKYPDFNVNWDAEVQKQWLIGMEKLYDGFALTPNS